MFWNNLHSVVSRKNIDLIVHRRERLNSLKNSLLDSTTSHELTEHVFLSSSVTYQRYKGHMPGSEPHISLVARKMMAILSLQAVLTCLTVTRICIVIYHVLVEWWS
jgi:hypothetical protein